MNNSKKLKKICLIASAGGHISELMQLNEAINNYDHFYVVPKTEWTKRIDGRKYFIKDLNRKNTITKIFTAIIMFIQQLPIFIKERPDVVITTGAAVAIPICLYAKLFHKKTIYIESICRINSRSATGNFLYGKVDLFIVQWKELLLCYSDAVYGGKIY